MVFLRNAYYVVLNFIQTNKKVSEIGYFYLIAINDKLLLPDLTDWNQIQNLHNPLRDSFYSRIPSTKAYKISFEGRAL